jgi:hypothetical protein
MTKPLTTAMIAAIACLSGCAQKLKQSQVPAATVVSFQRQYPNTKATWDKEDVGYEAEFKNGGKEMSVIIDDKGAIIETETMIAVSELPAAILGYMNKHYKGTTIEEAAKVVKGNGDINYEAEIKKKDIVFDANGNFLREVMD